MDKASPLFKLRLPVIVVTGKHGSGKSQPLDAKILTPNGWTTMGSMRVGGEVVDPSTGLPSRVIGVHPQGVREVFRLTFSDGGTAECCADHLWKVGHFPCRGMPDQVLPLKEIAAQMKKRPFFVPLCQPVQFARTKEQLPIDPWLLGALLGNGGLTAGTTVRFSSADEETVERVSSVLPSGMRMSQAGKCDHLLVTGSRGRRKNPLLDSLRDLGLYGSLSREKSIPDAYLRASVEDRLALLRGLCDTDGHASSPGYCEFSSSSADLARQVRELAWSLGGTASVGFRSQPTFTHRGELRLGHPSHRVYIRLPAGFCPFSLERKADRYNEPRKQRPSVMRKIVSVERTRLAECQCISVDSASKLYVTDDYVVTHNTVFSLTIGNDPTETCHYDFEHSATTYDISGLHRVEVPDIMRSKFPGGHRPIDLWRWWLADVRERVQPGRFRVCILDPVSELEAGLADYVRAHPAEFGATQAQYEKMSGVMWGHIKARYKQVLSELASRVECLVIIVHLGKEWSDNKPTGKSKPKGLDTLHELASLYLELRRDPQPSGEILLKPEGRVIKSRLAHMVFDTKLGEWEPQPILTPRLPEATPAAIRRFMEKPLDYKKLKKEYLAPEEKMSDEDAALLKLATAQAEAEAARDKLALADRYQANRTAQAAQALAAAQKSAAQLAADSAKMSQAADAVSEVGQTIEQQARELNESVLPADIPESPPESTPEPTPDQEPSADGPVAPGKLLKSQFATIESFREALRPAGLDDASWQNILQKRGVATVADLAQGNAGELLTALQQRLARFNAQQPVKESPVGASKS